MNFKQFCKNCGIDIDTITNNDSNIKVIYSLYSDVSRTYSYPMVSPNDNSMKLAISEQLTKDTVFANSASTSHLYKVGVFDIRTGILTNLDAPVEVCTLSDLINPS